MQWEVGTEAVQLRYVVNHAAAHLLKTDGLGLLGGGAGVPHVPACFRLFPYGTCYENG